MPTAKQTARLAAAATDADERRHEDLRWRHIAGGVTGSVSAGAVFSYLLLSKPLTDVLGFTPSQASWTGTIAWMAAMFTLPAGPFFDRFGARITNAIIFAVIIAGFILMGIWFHLAEVGGADQSGSWVRTPPDSWRVGTIMFTYGAMCWVASMGDLTLMLAPMSVFPATKQDALITTKPWMGLGGSVFAFFFIGFFKARDDARGMSNFYFFAAAVMLLIGALSTWGVSHLHRASADDAHDAAEILRAGSPNSPEEGDADAAAEADAATPEAKLAAHWTARVPARRMTALAFAMLGVSVVLLLVLGAVQGVTRGQAEFAKGEQPLSHGVNVFFAIVGILCIAQYWALPLLARCGPWAPAAPKGTLVVGVTSAFGRGENGAAEKELHERPRWERTRSDSLRASIKTPVFWSLFVTLGVCLSGQVVLTNNFAMAYASSLSSCYVFDAGMNATFAAIIAVCSAIGRAFVGILERAFPRMAPTSFLPLPPLLLCAALVTYASMLKGGSGATAFILPAMLHGLGEGMTWSAAGLVVSNLYGPKTIGLHYAVFAAAGFILIPVVLQGIIDPLHNKAIRDHPSGQWCCLGFECFGPAMYISAGICVLGAACAAVTHVLWLRTEASMAPSESELITVAEDKPESQDE